LRHIAAHSFEHIDRNKQSMTEPQGLALLKEGKRPKAAAA
jgi:hypothetical protein